VNEEEGEEEVTHHLPRPNRIRPKLFIGCQETAKNRLSLRSNRISHILDLTGNRPHFPLDFNYLTIEKLDDSPISDILNIFPKCIRFIQEGC